jgi:hypothetical protein
MTPRDPVTPRQWRRVMAMAEACLQLESARQYGLVVGGPAVNVDRCQALLFRGRALGHAPAAGLTDAALAALVQEHA